MDSIPHLAWPIRIVNGKYVTVQQDTDDEVIQCVGVIVSYRVGFRAEKPDFGILDPTFTDVPINEQDIMNAIDTFEPRAEASIEQTADATGKVSIRLSVTVPTSDELPEE